jgi:hypothetical protein
MADLRDFDRGDLEGYDPTWIEEVERDHRELYENHLLIARHLSAMAARHEADMSAAPENERAKSHEFAEGLRWAAAFLRQGDYILGGQLYGEE